MMRNLFKNIALFSTDAPDKTQEEEKVMVTRRRLLWLPAAADGGVRFQVAEKFFD